MYNMDLRRYEETELSASNDEIDAKKCQTTRPRQIHV